MFDQCSRKIYKFTGFFTPEEMNDLSILGGGGMGGGSRNYTGKNRDFGGKSPARVDLYFMSAP